MSEIEHLRAASRRAERLAKNMLDTVTIEKLREAARFNSHQADQSEQIRALPLLRRGCEPSVRWRD
jgi:hypothetical protein